MKQLYTFFSKAYIISILPALLIVFLISPDFKPYRLNLLSTQRLSNHDFFWYDDLNNDGSSERIWLMDRLNCASITIHNDNELLNQWNFRGSYNFSNKSTLFITGDYNDNGSKEVYVFSIFQDSIFLSAVSDPHDSKPMFRNRFISKTGWGINQPDPFIIPAEMADLDGDGQKELIFGIGTGFSRQPRNVFAYYIEKDSLVRSPESYFSINEIIQADLTGNGKPEFILSGTQPKNTNPDTIKYHDYSNWLMVLDQNLEFLFEPIEFDEGFSGIQSFVLYQDGQPTISSLLRSEKKKSVIYMHSPEGKLIDSRKLPFQTTGYILNPIIKGKEQLMLKDPDRGFVFLDENMNEKGLVKFPWSHRVFLADIIGNKLNEIIIPAYSRNQLVVYNSDFRRKATLNLFMETPQVCNFSVKRNPDKPGLISLQSGQTHYLIEYGKNPYYILNHSLYLLVYFFVFGFTHMIMKMQKLQSEKKHKAEKKINELQLSVIQNQLSSHFSLNVMNSILCSVMVNKPEEACENLRRLASLYRSVLFTAGKVTRTISEETGFCENYLLLEKSRFNGKLDFEINTSGSVDPDFPVPVMAAHLYVENAIKHGIAPLKGQGIITVNIDQTGKTLNIKIRDNGIGRINAANYSHHSTGKGIEIMNNIFMHLEAYDHYQIKSVITDLQGISGQPAGTMVNLSITKGHEKK